jgi:hypothetical protein
VIRANGDRTAQTMLRKFLQRFCIGGPLEDTPWVKVRVDWLTGNWYVESDTTYLVNKWLADNSSDASKS